MWHGWKININKDFKRIHINDFRFHWLLQIQKIKQPIIFWVVFVVTNLWLLGLKKLSAIVFVGEWSQKTVSHCFCWYSPTKTVADSFFETYAITSYSSHWRQDVISRCLAVWRIPIGDLSEHFCTPLSVRSYFSSLSLAAVATTTKNGFIMHNRSVVF